MTMIEKAVAMERISTALKAITGRLWSVTGGEREHWGRITVQAPISRRVGTKPGRLIGWEDDPDAPKSERWLTSREDCQALSQVFGCIVHSRGIGFTAASWEAVITRVERKAAEKESNEKQES